MSLSKVKKLIILSSFSIFSFLLFAKALDTLVSLREQKREMEIIRSISDAIGKDVGGLDQDSTEIIASAIYRISKKENLDYRIVLALAKIESNFRRDAVSPKGARGLLQVKPSVAKEIAKEIGINLEGKGSLHECEKNVALGTRLLSSLIEKFDDIHTALTAYNIGETRITNLNRSKVRSRFSESVLREYRRYVEILPDP